MEYITNMISNASSELVASLTTLIIISLFNRYKAAKKLIPSISKPTVKERIGLFARYIIMLVVLALIVAFASFNKFFVVLIAFIFSIVVVMFVYDYSMSILNTLVMDKEKEHFLNKKKINQNSINQLLDSIEQTDDKEKRHKLKLDLKELLLKQA